MSKRHASGRQAARSARRAVGYDMISGQKEYLRKMRQDEFGRYTTDPDPPHPQRYLLPIPTDRQKNDIILPPNETFSVWVRVEGPPPLAFQPINFSLVPDSSG